MKNTFVWLGRLEGISLLVLFFIAMPLKYLSGMPEVVRWVGSVHGGLFVFYVIMAMVIADRFNWSARMVGIAALLASLPFGTFYFEKKYVLP